MSRLGGKKRMPLNDCADVSKLHIIRLPSMAAAVKLAARPLWKKEMPRDREWIERIGNRPIDGCKGRLDSALEQSERLIDEAIDYDPRLAKRATWHRRDEGQHVDSALLAQGDDQPFYRRERQAVNDATNAGERLRIIVSTDDRTILPGTAAAFIAAIRIIQQFVPVEVWWQGAWLDRNCWVGAKGFIIHVPLVQGDMDFGRLEFCIADESRDSFSYHVMASHCIHDLRESWNGCGHRADRSHLPEEPEYYRQFISHAGIKPEGEDIASQCAIWLGWRPDWEVRYAQRQVEASALQSLPQEEGEGKTASVVSSDDLKRYRAQRQVEERQRKQEANQRINHV